MLRLSCIGWSGVRGRSKDRYPVVEAETVVDRGEFGVVLLQSEASCRCVSNLHVCVCLQAYTFCNKHNPGPDNPRERELQHMYM